MNNARSKYYVYLMQDIHHMYGGVFELTDKDICNLKDITTLSTEEVSKKYGHTVVKHRVIRSIVGESCDKEFTDLYNSNILNIDLNKPSNILIMNITERTALKYTISFNHKLDGELSAGKFKVLG